MSTIYVSVHPEETRMGVVNNHKLVDFVVERSSEQHLVSSVFKGKVTRVVRNIQAAFVDIGKEQNAFLYVAKNEHVNEGDTLLVQVTKDARSTKGPAVTRNITLPGRYVVLQPFAHKVALSKQITGKGERKRLRQIGEQHQPPHMGLVIRTAAQNVAAEEIAADIAGLVTDWQVIEARGKRGKAPLLLYRELDLPVRIVRDYVTAEVHKIEIDDEATCKRVLDLLDSMEMDDIGVVYYSQKEDIFHKYKLHRQIEAMSDRLVWLDCGGYLVFDQTEAMTVVDVNSGKYSGKTTLSQTILDVNKEAAEEVARQLRLRDIGGIVVVDFIDMQEEKQQESILQHLRLALAGDKMKPKVHDITALNLVEITRRKARQNLSTVLYSTCPTCQGSGRVQSPETIAVEIRRRLRSFKAAGHLSRYLTITVHPTVAPWLVTNALQDMEKEFSCKLTVESDAASQVEAFALLAGKK